MGPRGDSLLQFDWIVGQILASLEKNGLDENTLIIVTSDNGPVVDDGYQDQAVELLGDHRPWGDLRGGKYSNFEAGTRVPFIVRWTGKVKPQVSDALVSHIDLFASLAKLVDAEVPTDAAPDSKDYLAAFLGEDTKGRAYVVEAANALSVSDGTWKYITPNDYSPYSKETNTELGNAPEDQLYNLKEDVGEKENVAAAHPREVERLKAILDKEKNK